MWTSAIQTLVGKMSIELLRPTIDNGLSWTWVHHWPRNTSYNMRRFQEAQAKARSGNDAKMRCFFFCTSIPGFDGTAGAVGWRDQKLHQAVNKLSRNTPEDLSSWPVLTECCYPSFDCLVNPNHQNSGDGTFFKWMHQIQSPTSFAEAHGVFAPLQIHTRRGKCMFKHHTASTGGCKSMPTTSRQQKVMPKAGLSRVMLTLHALAKTCWKLWRCLPTETWHAYKLPLENTESDTSIHTVCSFISEKVIRICICFPYLLLCASIPPTSKRQNIHIFVFVACCCDLTGDRPTYFKQKERAKYDAWVIASGRLSKLQTV